MVKETEASSWQLFRERDIPPDPVVAPLKQKRPSACRRTALLLLIKPDRYFYFIFKVCPTIPFRSYYLHREPHHEQFYNLLDWYWIHQAGKGICVEWFH